MTSSGKTQCASRRATGFSLVELVVVVVIIGVIAAIAVPRISSAATGSEAHALQMSLANVRKAIDEYYAEHGKYPGYNPGTGAPADAAFVRQLTRYTDVDGNMQNAYGWPFIYGPYLRQSFPKNPINGLSTVKVKATPGTADPAAGTFGWIAVLSHGYFGIHATAVELDARKLTGSVDAGAFKADR